MKELKTAYLFGTVPLSPPVQGKQQTVLLVPDGKGELKDGTEITLDRDGAADAIAAFNKHGADLPFDRNHATVLKGCVGEHAPAYGWGDRMHYEEGVGLLCAVEWGEEGYDDIVKKRYRYLSPVIGYEADTGRVRAVTSVGMTNTPAQPNMPALAASEFGPRIQQRKETRSMKGLIEKMLQEEGTVATAEQKIGELKAWLEANGVELGDGADFVAIINASLAKHKGEATESDEKKKAEETVDATVAASVRESLGLAKDADLVLVTKAMSDRAGHVGYVPAAKFAEVSTRLASLEDAQADRAAEDLVDKALSAGKLLDSDTEQMKWARDRAKNAPEDFAQVMLHAPVIVPQGRTTPPEHPGGPTGTTNEQKLIDKSLADHDGKHKEASVALQRKLLSEQEGRGLSRKAAGEACTRLYPTIFG